MTRVVLPLAVVMACCVPASAEVNEQEMFPPLADLLPDTPAGFARFDLPGNEERAQVLNRYLWYHFRTRLGHSPTLFNKEYLTTADMWVGGAERPDWPKSAQATLRESLLAVGLNPDGYVHTHQHFAHAHEQGWPFPTWFNAPQGRAGFTAGWHFQNDGPGWAWQHFLRSRPESPYGRAKAIEGWELENLRSLGIVDGKWRLESTGASPRITTPKGVQIDPSNAPFLQLRWKRSGTPDGLPYVEWMRNEDTDFSAERRMSFGFDSGNPDYERVSGTTHSMIPVHRHALWNGKIDRIRIALAPGESDVVFDIDSFFTVYDTRHTINNPIFILACWDYFRWTGELPFLNEVIGKMRRALRYQQTEMGGLRYNRIRNTWIGHDGLPGYDVNPGGAKTPHYGHGIGSNYWDLLPFGWDDMYATAQYYAATLAMAEAEAAVAAHPQWGLADGALDPDALRKHAARVKDEANRIFWNPKTQRFVACIDKNGDAHDYGFTFLNLDAIWYGIASEDHARTILDWLDGNRIVAGDTSTGADIYRWRFGPRATTRRNVEWYSFVWTGPETIPWGGQVQDGGAVLGFTFYDLWARLHVLGSDDAWRRLCAILDWEQEVWSAPHREDVSPYRAYYEGGARGTTLQGGGPPGGLGIDKEFYESSLLPAIIVQGFLGLRPGAEGLAIRPQLPAACPQMGVRNLLYRGTALDIKAGSDTLAIRVTTAPNEPLHIMLPEPWLRVGTGEEGRTFALDAAGIYEFVKAK